MNWNNATDKQYIDEKERLIEKVILHMTDPENHGCPRLTYDEVSVLMSKDKKSMMSKMGICKIEQRALKKIRASLNRVGIKNLSDAMDIESGREAAQQIRKSDW